MYKRLEINAFVEFLILVVISDETVTVQIKKNAYTQFILLVFIT